MNHPDNLKAAESTTNREPMDQDELEAEMWLAEWRAEHEIDNREWEQLRSEFPSRSVS